MGKLLIGIPFVVALASIILNIILIFVFSWSYHALTYETVIAKITFDKQNLNDKTYVAHVTEEDNSSIGDFKIYGEQWRIDAKFMKMKYWANILGLDARYALERFEGRYKYIQDENTKQQVAYDLGENTLIDSFSLFGWNPFVDAEYGSSAYQDINSEYVYTVYKTQNGIIVRTHPPDTNTTKSSIMDYFFWLK